MKKRPNILAFFTDQQRWDTLGLNGYSEKLTPNFDRLARQGTFFKEAVTPQPVCGPCRSCLQTGQYATTTGVWRNGLELKPESPKLAELLSDAGYRTSYFGKWHLSSGTGRGPVPEENRAGYQDWLAANAVEGVSGPYSSVLWNEKNEEIHLPGYRVDAQTDAMIRYLHDRAGEKGQDSKPFLCFQSYLEPHHQNSDHSYPAPDGMDALYRAAPLPPDLQELGGSSSQDWAGYCGMIKRLDEALGRTMDTLKSTGLIENTIVVFVSDHGCHFRTRNGEFKRSPHESSVRVPFAAWGGKFNGGGERLEAVNLVDLMPTLLDVCGVEIPEDVQGRSLLPLTRNENENWRVANLIQFGDGGMPPGRAVRTSSWKYAVTASEEFVNQGDAPEYVETHLYDLRTDPYELRNIVNAESHVPIKAKLKRMLLDLMKEEAGEDLPVIHDALSKPSGQRRVEYPFGLPES